MGGRDAVFIDRPTILTRHRFPALQAGRLVLVSATDIVSNEVGVALTEPDGFVARMDQGVFDTNLEAALAAGDTVLGNAAEAFATSDGWRTVSGHNREELDGLPLAAPARTLLNGDLDSGFTVVIPAEPVGDGGPAFMGWWRIDPATGHTIGIGDRGWGQATDYSLMTEVLVTMAREFVWEYALCQAIPQVDNSLRIIGTEFWTRGWAPSWTRPPEPGKNVEEVALENHRTCLISAIIQGYVATAPLLLMTMRYRSAVLMAERGGSFWRRARNRGNSTCILGRAPSRVGEGRYAVYDRSGELPVRLAGYSGSAPFSLAGGRAAPIVPVAAPATALICKRPGKGLSGPGKWLRTFGGGANMRGPEAAFQRKVSGRPANWGYFIKGTEFDGYRKGVLLDAKYFTNEGQFVKNQYYREWVKGPELLDQAKTQVAKSGGARIEWHVPSKEAKVYLDQMMKANDLPIKVVVS